MKDASLVLALPIEKEGEMGHELQLRTMYITG